MNILNILKFLTARLDEEQAAAEAAQRSDPAPWMADTTATASTELRHGHGAGLVVAADDTALWDCEGSHILCMTAATAQHVSHHDPARVLREVAAKRRLLAQATEMRELAAATEAWFLVDMAAGIEQQLAAPHADHPDFDPGWYET